MDRLRHLGLELIETVREPLLLIEPGPNVVMVNGAFARAFSVLPEEVAGLPLIELCGGRLATPQLLKKLDSVLAGGEAFDHQIVECQVPGAGRMVLKLGARLLRAGESQPLALLAVQDQTEKALAERLVAESNERFMRMAASISQVFWITDLDKNVMIYVSPAYEDIWGRGRGGLYANPRSWLDAIVPEDRERVLAAVPRQAAGGYDETYRIRRPDGEVRWIRDRAFPIKDGAGRTTQITGVAQDVTAELEAKAELLEAQEVANLGSWVNKLDGGDLIWSKQCRRLFGLPETGPIREPDLFRRIHPDDFETFRSARARTIEDGAPFAMEVRVVHPDGAVRLMSVRAESHVNKADGRRRVLGIAQDVTEIREKEKRLREAEEQLSQSQKMEAMGRLAGGVAHDFNNILTAILGLSEITIEALPDGPMKEDVKEIRASGQRAANLTQQLLAFSRRQVTSPRILDVDDIVAGLGKMLRRIIGEHIILVLEPSASGALVKADAGQLEQVVMNLVVNARDAMPKGGRIVVRTEELIVDERNARERRAPPGRYAALSVIDEGVGMSEEIKSHIFEPFFTTKEKGKGTGLGLSTVYGVVKQNGGEISVETAEGRGTTFRILLPCVVAASAGPAPQGARAPGAGGETILLVEDDANVRRLTTRLLSTLGYRVLEAPNGRDGLALLRSDAGRAVSLLVTDMIMPGMSGWDLASAAGVERSGLPVLFVSGYTADVFEGMCVIDDKTDILAKPYTAEELGARVRAALDRARA